MPSSYLPNLQKRSLACRECGSPNTQPGFSYYNMTTPYRKSSPYPIHRNARSSSVCLSPVNLHKYPVFMTWMRQQHILYVDKNVTGMLNNNQSFKIIRITTQRTVLNHWFSNWLKTNCIKFKISWLDNAQTQYRRYITSTCNSFIHVQLNIKLAITSKYILKETFKWISILYHQVKQRSI